MLLDDERPLSNGFPSRYSEKRTLSSRSGRRDRKDIGALGSRGESRARVRFSRPQRASDAEQSELVGYWSRLVSGPSTE